MNTARSLDDPIYSSPQCSTSQFCLCSETEVDPTSGELLTPVDELPLSPETIAKLKEMHLTDLGSILDSSRSTLGSYDFSPSEIAGIATLLYSEYGYVLGE